MRYCYLDSVLIGNRKVNSVMLKSLKKFSIVASTAIVLTSVGSVSLIPAVTGNEGITTVSAAKVKYHEGINKTVWLNKHTARWYVSKTKINNMLSTGLIVSVFMPGSTYYWLSAKAALAAVGIWGKAPGGFRVDITKDSHGRTSWTNFHWQ